MMDDSVTVIVLGSSNIAVEETEYTFKYKCFDSKQNNCSKSGIFSF